MIYGKDGRGKKVKISTLMTTDGTTEGKKYNNGEDLHLERKEQEEKRE